MAENPQREKVGLRTVKATWHLYRVDFGAEDWKIKENAALAKRIQRGYNGGPQWEEDYYQSGKTYPTENGGKYSESITVHYNWGPGTMEVHYIGEDRRAREAFDDLKVKTSTATERITLVDETLKKWGLSRLE